MSKFTHVIDANRFVRVLGRDRPAVQVLARAVRRSNAPISMRSSESDGSPNVDAYCEESEAEGADVQDYTLLDPSLTIAPDFDTAPRATLHEDLQSGTGYAGMTPVQRASYLTWLLDPSQPAPPAYQELYIATLEVRLLEGLENEVNGGDAHLTMRSLQYQAAWHGSRPLERAIVLGYWLSQDGPGLAHWLTVSPMTTYLLEVGLGMQAILGEPLTIGELPKIGAVWDQPALAAPEAVLKMRLASLTTNLDAEPLTYALDSLTEADHGPRPWRCAHRDLRISLPQPPVRSVLEPVLCEMASIRAPETILVPDEQPGIDALTIQNNDTTGSDISDDYLILEFGQSRSEYFDYVLQLAQRHSDFTQLMDEDRRLIYRVRYRKDKLRNFWRIWEYVQNWSTTKVYVNGEEVEHWKIWPYSQYLR